MLEGNYGGDITKMPYVVNKEAFGKLRSFTTDGFARIDTDQEPFTAINRSRQMKFR